MLLLLLACAADVVDWCAANPEDCLTCTTDADCGFGGNPCTEVVFCAHAAQEISVVAIGCSPELEHTWPPDSACTCDAGVCASGLGD